MAAAGAAVGDAARLTSPKAASTGDLHATVSDMGGEASAGEDGSGLDGASPTRRVRRKPGARWNGRVGDLSLKEYREMKWGLDASYRQALKGGGGPSFTMGPSIPIRTRSSTNTWLSIDPAESFNRTLPCPPSFTMGRPLLNNETSKEKTKGPGHYQIQSVMAPKHPTYNKHSGNTFGDRITKTLKQDGPAPGQYDVDEAYPHASHISKAPIYTAQGREAWGESTKPTGPPPGSYNCGKISTKGKDSTTRHRYSFQGTPGPLDKGKGRTMHKPPPGVGAYSPPGAGGKHEAAYYKHPDYRFSRTSRGLT